MKKLTAKERMVRARTWLITNPKFAFFGTLAISLKFVEDESCETMATDGTSLFYAPSFVDTITDEEIRGTIIHEILHCAFQHHTRRNNRDPDEWNIAADYVINPVVNESGSGIKLPDGALFDIQFKGMGAEEVYARRRKAQPGQPQAGPPGGNGLGGKPTGPGGNTPSQGPSGSAQQPNTGGQQGPNGQGGGNGLTPRGNQPQGPGNAAGAGQGTGNGNGLGGKPRGQPGRVLDAAPAHSLGGNAEATADWDRRVRQAVSVAMANNAGNIPGNLVSLVEAIKKPKVDWREELRRFIDAKTRTDYSWTNPNRRMLHTGFVMPGVRQDGIGKLGIVVDTSGSVSDRALDVFFGEINSAMELGAVGSVVIIQCDTRVTKVDRFDAGEEINIECPGRGGTMFSPALKWFEDNEPDVAALIYFTDLDCTDWGEEPSVPLLWAAYGFESRIDRLAKSVPFGEVIKMETN